MIFKNIAKIWQWFGRILSFGLFSIIFLLSIANHVHAQAAKNVRQRILLDHDWKFFKYSTSEQSDSLIYDVRPDVRGNKDYKIADAKPTDAEHAASTKFVLKPWILPTGNDFIKDPTKKFIRPDGNPGSNFPFVQNDFNDSAWETINIPHDWAVNGPFYKGPNPEVGGGMGRLPVHGVAWYRKKLDIPKSDEGKSIYLDIDGAMSYSIVWLNGKLVGGWPYGYSSWRVDLTPYIIFGTDNQLAIRLDNPNNSSRWYPGGGIYRNVWLVKTDPVHIDKWGVNVTTEVLSKSSAKINVAVTIKNNFINDANVKIETELYELNADGKIKDKAVAIIDLANVSISSKSKTKIDLTTTIENPKLWGPPPTQTPNLYLAVTRIMKGDQVVDQYEIKFGIRSLRLDSNQGVIVNDELIKINGVNQHHDLGALGAAFNYRAAERQLEILQEMGCNAIRMSHNPPAPELLDLTDRMGFLVIDEAFDVWEMKKTPLDFHLIFPDWHEQDLRSMVRRDRNHPSVILWSSGNEVGEQYTDAKGAAIAKKLSEIIKDEDSTRLVTAAMNWAKPFMPLPAELDVISLNYQGEGIRQDPIFEGTDRIRTAPQYDPYHEKFPDKVILGSESASTFSSRGVYLFPVINDISSFIRDGRGGDSKINHVSSYELYAVDFGSSPDKVFGSLDRHPFVAGEFVWTGWDHLGEPTPYYDARSSYCGIIDIAGFKKDRFYLYQSRWRPDFPMAHILPHWNWPDRIGEVTPVHVFTSGDEAELFLNNKSFGKKKKNQYEYRLRWDDVVYQPGELKVVAYKNGEKWAEDAVKTAGEPFSLEATADRNVINADGKDLSFITIRVLDKDGNFVPTSTNKIEFGINGCGEIAATDNGDPTSFVPFSSHQREAFSGMALVIVRSKNGEPGDITITVKSAGLKKSKIVLSSK